MLVVVSCPICGHLGRVPKARIGHKVRCKGCGNTFRPEAELAQPSPEDEKGAKTGSKRSEEKEPRRSRFGWLRRPAVIDGAISGAIGGILTGILIGAINGGMNTKFKPPEVDPMTGVKKPSSGVLAGAVGGGLQGFIVGFLCGAPLGGALGLAASYFPAAILAASRRRAIVTGMLAGAGVTAIISRYPWMIAVGVLPGALGSGLWSLLQNWEQRADTPFVSGFQVQEEEEEEPSKAAKAFGEE